VAETQRVESAFKAREREVAKEERERERRMREEVEEREGEVERQVEETKRVESALRVREKEVRELKVGPSCSGYLGSTSHRPLTQPCALAPL
jgi:hypothetical protein